MTLFSLPQNIMTFNKCSISGKCYGDVLDDNGVQVDPESVSTSHVFHSDLPTSHTLISPFLN